MSRPFRSFGGAVQTPKTWSAREVVDIARQLLAEHTTSREAATRAANLVCGACSGSGNTQSTLMPGELVKCFACQGNGQPNELGGITVPDFTPEDNQRLWKIGQLLQGPHRVAVLALVKDAYPDLYGAAAADLTVN